MAHGNGMVRSSLLALAFVSFIWRGRSGGIDQIRSEHFLVWIDRVNGISFSHLTFVAMAHVAASGAVQRNISGQGSG